MYAAFKLLHNLERIQKELLQQEEEIKKQSIT